MNDASNHARQDTQAHIDGQNTEEQGDFQITISESEVDQDILEDIHILDVQEQTPAALDPGKTRTEGVMLTLTEADLKQSQMPVIRVDLPPEPPKAPEVNCVFCHEAIKPDERAVICPKQHPHHWDCWQWNGGRCGMHGCGETQYRAFDVTKQAPQENDAIKLSKQDNTLNILTKLWQELSS